MDEEYIKFNEDEKEVCLKELKDLYNSTGTLFEYIKKDTLTEEMKEILFSLMEFHISNVSKSLNLESESAKKIEERHREIREANMKIYRLEQQIGNTYSVENIKQQLKYINNIISEWWDLEGFHHISDACFTPYGIYKAEFCIMLEYMSGIFSKKPVTERNKHKAWIEYLNEQGYIVHCDKNGREPYLVDCKENRHKITQLIKKAFPTAVISKWDNWYENDNDEYQIRHFDVYIYNLNEIKNIEKYVKENSSEDY